MGIFSRLTDIVNANLNAVLDRAEDPEKMVRQMIHEMEDTLVEVRSQRGAHDRRPQGHGAPPRSGSARRRPSGRRKAELALSKEREDLARAALVEKARLAARTSKALDEELVHLDEGARQVRGGHRQARGEAARGQGQAEGDPGAPRDRGLAPRVRRQVHDRRIDDAFVRFEQMERRLDGAEGEVEAFDLGRGKPGRSPTRSTISPPTSAVDEELAALKQRLAKGQARSESR